MSPQSLRHHIEAKQLRRLHRLYSSRSAAAKAAGVSHTTLTLAAKRLNIEEPEGWRRAKYKPRKK